MTPSRPVPPIRRDGAPATRLGRSRWSWRVGRVAGIDLYVHATFPLLFAWIAATAWARGAGWSGVANSLLLIAIVFATVVLHEFAHALTARRFGVGTRDITLLPIGGVSHMERMPEKPSQELQVALAGPLVNIVLAVLLWGLVRLTGTPLAPPADLTQGALLPQLVWVNVSLAVFNLLPAFPMDGGRVLRAALALRMPRVRATTVAAKLGQWMAIGFGLLGLMGGNPMLLLIAVFVWAGAAVESSQVQLEAALEGITVGEAMATEIHLLAPADPVSRAVEFALGGFQRDFPVVDDGHVAGLLTHRDLLRALADRGAASAVGEAMHRHVAVATKDTLVTTAMPALTGADAAEPGPSALVVTDGDRVVGMLTTDQLGELVLVGEALHAKG